MKHDTPLQSQFVLLKTQDVRFLIAVHILSSEIYE